MGFMERVCGRMLMMVRRGTQKVLDSASRALTLVSEGDPVREALKQL